MVAVAQLARAPGCGPGGRGFETPRSPQATRRLASRAQLTATVTVTRLWSNAGRCLPWWCRDRQTETPPTGASTSRAWPIATHVTCPYRPRPKTPRTRRLASHAPTRRFPAEPAGNTIADDEETCMRAAIFNGPKDIGVGERPDPRIEAPTDAIVRVVLACVCGSDLWYWRGQTPPDRTGIGPEVIGGVEAGGPAGAAGRAGGVVLPPLPPHGGASSEHPRREPTAGGP